MIKHILGIVAATAFAFFCTLLPFLPGSYDGLAVALSEMAHMFGILGLLLVPIGLLWIAADRSERLSQKRHLFPLLPLIASTLVRAGLSLAALMQRRVVLRFAVNAMSVSDPRYPWTRLSRPCTT